MAADHRLGFRNGEGHPPTDLPVEGDLPEWLSGVLLRNGPGRFSVGDQTVNHWFDGFALLRRFAIRDGGVEYASRFLRSDAYERARSEGALRHDEFGTRPDDGLRGRLRRLISGELTDNASITVTHRGGEFVAVTEPPRAWAFDPDSLRTLEPRRFDDGVDATGSTAHRHYDPRRGETWGLATRHGRNGGYVLHRRPDGSSRREPVATIEVDQPAYIHSFALTDRYAVVTEPPFVTSPRRLLTADTFLDAHEWRPEQGTRFFVCERAIGAVAGPYRADPCFVFHHANAFEADGELVVDLVAFDDASAVTDFELSNLRSAEPDLPAGELRRYRLPVGPTDSDEMPSVPSPEAARATASETPVEPTPTTLHEGPVAFPAIDYVERNGRSYRYVYAAGNRHDPPETFLNRLIKVDVGTGDARTWSEAGVHPGEPVFVPAPPGRRDGEDDGVVLSVVLDTDEERSALVVLDAVDLSVRARAPLPHALPIGFHGQFYRDGSRPIQSMA
ncbi:Carotenoid cleavage dioxygenase [Natronoarchaeum philippinense]|uniref:Carotenoid cleavage dioxygenase n=1 Tax=Natronoarchaeum philippinense TaxID=558529 RepID=A0A285PA08_NATPI|nr:carotenoid oxygenase family protein [Natronoarchaeum philippinense]SNZ18043.1 Carotenoid cleavage dioxygenase [Natronoarchaeum philippinense]